MSNVDDTIFLENRPRPAIALPLRTELQSRFAVGRLLGRPGGFGITYLALDLRLQRTVALKEYFPRNLAAREGGTTVVAQTHDDGEQLRFGRERFLHEARTLARFDHQGIVRVQDFFEANGTAYLVMPYYEGETLEAYLRAQPWGRLDERTAVALMLRVMDALRIVHEAGLLHRDIKPENIYLRHPTGQPTLLDFGSAQAETAQRSMTVERALTPGYAAVEQYITDGVQGPWTDVYACGATLYRLLTGQVPPEALARIGPSDPLRPLSVIAPEVNAAVAASVAWALQPQAIARPQDARTLQHRLQEAVKGEGFAAAIATAPLIAMPNAGVPHAAMPHAAAPNAEAPLRASPPPERAEGEGATHRATVALRTIAIGATVWLTAWLLPTVNENPGIGHGWYAFFYVLTSATPGLLRPWLLFDDGFLAGVTGLAVAVAPLTNIVLVASLLGAFAWSAHARLKWLAWAMAACALVNLVWLIEPSHLLIGYYAWLTGFVVVAAGTYLLVRERVAPAAGAARIAARGPFGLALAGVMAALFLAAFTVHSPRSARLAAESDDRQWAAVNAAVDRPARVRVFDQFGRAMAGVRVRFQVVAGGGSVGGAEALSDASGYAAPRSWSLGGVTGDNVLEGSVEGLEPVRFVAVATRTTAQAQDATDEHAADTREGVAYSRANPNGAYGRTPHRARFTLTWDRSDRPDPFGPNARGWSIDQIYAARSDLHLSTEGYRRLPLAPGNAFNLKIEFMDRNTWGGLQVRRTGTDQLAVRTQGGDRWIAVSSGTSQPFWWNADETDRSPRYGILIQNGGTSPSKADEVLVEYRFAIENR